MDKRGKVYLVGAGPGAPGLITQKGIELLQICDVVIYDRLVSPILLNYVKTGCEKIYVGKSAGKHSMKQEEINQIIIDKALHSEIVVRLKGGDPFVFGRGGEEVLKLKENGISYEVIPGVSSAVAALTYAGIPITHRGTSQSFHVITGHTAEEASTIPEDIKNLAKLEGTLVILMGLGNLSVIRDELLANGKPKETPVAVISNGTTNWQKEVRGTLETICQKVEESFIKSPAIIVVGAVAEFDLRAGIEGSLSGLRVGITGTKAITDKLTQGLEELGAKVDVVSTSVVAEFKENKEFEQALRKLAQFQWIVFTSTNAVTIYFNRMKELQMDLRTLAHIKFAVIGSGTRQALLQQGFQADFMPSQYNTVQLGLELSQIIGDKEKILIPRAKQGSDELIDILKKHHKSYEDIKIYDIVENEVVTDDWTDRWNCFDYLTFVSSSGVYGLIKGKSINPKELAATKLVCIGEATEAALRERGFEQILVAKEASVSGIVDRIQEDYFACNI